MAAAARVPGTSDTSDRVPTKVDSPTDPPRILVVDDDRDVRLALATYFSAEGFEVDAAADGARALELMSDEPGFDLVLLDVVLPELNGFEVLEKSHELGLSSPVLMMSARGNQENILTGFGLGAQDYIVKPFDPDDLLQRTAALLGRSFRSDELPLRYTIGERTVHLDAARITWGDVEVDVSEMEMDILRCLVRNRGCVVTKKRLLREAWHIDDDMIAHTINPDIAMERIDASVRSLRRKLEPTPDRPQFIHTVYGLGYRLSG